MGLRQAPTCIRKELGALNTIRGFIRQSKGVTGHIIRKFPCHRFNRRMDKILRQKLASAGSEPGVGKTSVLAKVPEEGREEGSRTI